MKEPFRDENENDDLALEIDKDTPLDKDPVSEVDVVPYAGPERRERKGRRSADLLNPALPALNISTKAFFFLACGVSFAFGAAFPLAGFICGFLLIAYGGNLILKLRWTVYRVLWSIDGV